MKKIKVFGKNNLSLKQSVHGAKMWAVGLVEAIELKKEIVQKREFLKPFDEQSGYDLWLFIG